MGSAERLLKLFPGLLAGGLALVYILGAVATGSEFEGVGIDPTDAVPLLSIEQLLARGIGVLVRPTTFMTILAVLLLVMTFVFRLSDPGHKPVSPERLRTAIAAAFGATSLFALFLIPVDQIAGMVIGSVGLTGAFVLTHSDAEWSQRWRGLAPLLITVAVFLGLGANAYTDPAPLPTVKLSLTSSLDVPEGRFITHRDSTWYLYNSAAEAIEAYSDAEVVSAVINERPSGSSNDDQTLAVYAWDGLTSLPPFD